MMIRILLILATACCSIILQGQSVFYNHGSIKYIRKTNAFRLTEGSWLNNYFIKEKFKTDTFQLDFDSAHSLYFSPSYDPDVISQQEMYFSIKIAPSESNIVYKDLKTDTLWAIRDLFDERIVINDSFRNIKWKITDEVREIAGFSCHKAVGILYDSMYVVAFYTDQIMPKSGPETFGNLPGMIMGLAIPRLYTTWMAYEFKPESKVIHKPSIPKKKKSHYNWNTYYTGLSERFRNWGDLYKTLMVWMWGV